ncbi:sigma-70 family RNA polymerase sigma factor [Achromobacter pestifer]|uniref:Sigma-70 family RNA polymerase sigma factor n=1 Tax=Achromobacter pestifer TaxID=1353889 RepID=A0A7D4IMF3_9BURK|nr:sigma-70 family RNA polymerase sigma factor [Achromobacter pestifer]QKH38863.1 sigma-70 family RNA polymerase sigma factor [Achromobacter pestifer]
MEQYYKELLRFLARKLGNSHDAADVVQETYARVLGRDGGAAIEQPRAFLFRAAINLSLDLRRQQLAQATLPLDAQAESQPCPAAGLEDRAYRRQQLSRLDRALAELPANCRQAFLMRQVEGLSHQEIASRLDISRDMVGKHIVRALRHCRLRMRAWESTSGD